MAVTLLQQPTTPNASYTNLVYVMSGSNATQPQYRYVVDVYYSGSSDTLTRIKTYPNSTYNGIIDVSRELQDYLDYDQYWKATGSLDPVESVKTFDLRFGEEYGTSLSSSRTIYTGSTSNYLELFPGRMYKNESQYNWTTSSLYLNSYGTYNNIMSANPENVYIFGGFSGSTANYVTFQDYHTITIFTASNVDIDIYNSNNVKIASESISANDFSTIGIGPKNLTDYGGPLSAITASNSFYYQVSAGNTAGVGSSALYTMYLTDRGGGYGKDFCSPVTGSGEYTRFAWISQFGFWEYYNVFNARKQFTDIDRSLYHRPFVRYADSLSSYDVSYRGNKQYKTDYRDTFEVQTDYINKADADWLTELFESPDVYLQVQKDVDTKFSPVTYPNFIPINILNTSVNWQLKDNREKLFQYTIQFKYSNDRQSR